MPHTPDQEQQPEEHVQPTPQPDQARPESDHVEPTAVQLDQSDIAASGHTSLTSQSGQPGPGPAGPGEVHSEPVFSPRELPGGEAGQPATRSELLSVEAGDIQGQPLSGASSAPPPSIPLQSQSGFPGSQPVAPSWQTPLSQSQAQMGSASPLPTSPQTQAQVEPPVDESVAGQPQAPSPLAPPVSVPPVASDGAQIHPGQLEPNVRLTQAQLPVARTMNQPAVGQPQVQTPRDQPVSGPISEPQPVRPQLVQPAQPVAPAMPVAPAQPVAPAMPAAPAQPVAPAIPAAPAQPVAPAMPAAPAQPAARPVLRQPQPGAVTPNAVPAQPRQTLQRPTLQRPQSGPAASGAAPPQSQPRPGLSKSAKGPAAADEQNNQSKVIMVVDDSQTVRNIMALILHRAGLRSVRVASAMEALHTLTELTPDLIFLDITLPGMDGLDVCKIIKENPRTKHVPVVMLSGNNEVFDKVMGRLAGASDYITKPFEPESILKCVQTFCGQEKRLREGLWQGAR